VGRGALFHPGEARSGNRSRRIEAQPTAGAVPQVMPGFFLVCAALAAVM
jgi:hypothetical protein